MAMEKAWREIDQAIFDKRDASLLLDRSRRDALARIRDESIESFSYLYNMEYERANQMEAEIRKDRGLPELKGGERIADWCIEWTTDILGLSPAGGGRRANQIEAVLKSHRSGGYDDEDDLDTQGRGLKHRG